MNKKKLHDLTLYLEFLLANKDKIKEFAIESYQPYIEIVNENSNNWKEFLPKDYNKIRITIEMKKE